MKKTIITFLTLTGLVGIAPTLANAAGSAPNKDSANYYVSKAQEELTARRLNNAWRYFEKAANFDAGNADIQKGIAEVCFNLHKPAPAIQALEKYYNMRPNDNVALQQLTKMYFDFGSWEKVIKFAPQLHSRNPSETSWAFMLGKSYFSLQEYGKAIENLEQAIKLDPNNAEAYYLIGHTYTLESNYNAAIPYYRRSLALDSVTSNQSRLNEFAIVLSTAGKFEESIQAFQTILDKGYKTRDDFFMNFANTLADAHHTERAIKTFEDMLKRRPNDLGLLEALADVCYKGGKYQLAIDYGEKILNVDDHNGRALYQVGLAYIKSGKKEVGQSICDKAIALDPSLESLRRKSSGMM
jgi:tetratricopeptide (TPR) repeat protein